MSEVWTVGRLLEWTAPFFKQRGIDNPRLDAEVLLSHVLTIPRLHLYTGYDRPLEQQELDAYRALVKRRATREPVAYITGSKGFHDIDLKVDKRVLIPRPETEMIVERLRVLKPSRFADIGTGSGAIVLAALKALPEATAVATDVSADALAVARENAAVLGLSSRVEFREGRFCEPLGQDRFDVIATNPPYVERGAVLDPDVVDHEPHLALFAGDDGLDVIRVLLRDAPAQRVLLEFGKGQGQAICEIAKANGYSDICLHKDHSGLERLLEATRQWTR